jgi:hypothetical protein
MKRLVFLLEEKSMFEALNTILTSLLPHDCQHLCIPHNGKNDLQKMIPYRLRRWNNAGDKFIVVHDAHTGDCITLKNHLKKLVSQGSKPDTVIRIVCSELESWFLGDLQAVEKAFSLDLSGIKDKALYREPDEISNAKQELRKLAPEYKEVSDAKNISQYMDIENNKSHSFNVFINGVKKLCG